MKQQWYSVQELSEILDLHPKTVQRLLRDGVIRGSKIGRSWRVHYDDLRSYAHAELRPEASAASGVAEQREVGHGAATRDGGEPSVRVSAVVEIREQDSEEASRVSNGLMAMLNSKDPAWGEVRYDFVYHPETRKARHLIYGSPAFIAEIMRSFSIISQQLK